MSEREKERDSENSEAHILARVRLCRARAPESGTSLVGRATACVWACAERVEMTGQRPNAPIASFLVRGTGRKKTKEWKQRASERSASAHTPARRAFTSPRSSLASRAPRPSLSLSQQYCEPSLPPRSPAPRPRPSPVNASSSQQQQTCRVAAVVVAAVAAAAAVGRRRRARPSRPWTAPRRGTRTGTPTSARTPTCTTRQVA